MKISSLIRACTAIVFILITTNCYSTKFHDKNVKIEIPSQIIKIIEIKYPDKNIFDSKDFNASECEDLYYINGVISSDFNGDKLTDYAIKIIDKSPKKYLYENKFYLSYKSVFLVFMKNKYGSYDAVNISEVDDSIPSVYGLTLYDDSELFDLDSYVAGSFKKINVLNHGIVVNSCGKGSRTYIWNGSNFVGYTTSK